MQYILTNLKNLYRINFTQKNNKLFKRSYVQIFNTMNERADRIIWVDLEMTGLNFEKDTILEAACVITEEDLSIVAETPDFVVHQSDEVLDAMVPWCKQQHSKTGLIQSCIESTLTLPMLDETLCDFVKRYTPPEQCCLAGNSVYVDRIFMKKHLPNFEKHLHYRIIDVSTVKELMRRWGHHCYQNRPEKLFVHRAREDILESIKELKYYKKEMFK